MDELPPTTVSPALRPGDEPKTTNFQRLKRRLVRECANAITDYEMIRDGDRVMVCLSGGKDSYTMLSLLQHLQRRAPINFTLIAMNLDQKQPGFPEHVLPEYLDALGAEYKIVEADTYSIVTDKLPETKTYCSLCSRLRRGIIYRTAEELGATKIALGHHREDIVETLFLNLFFGAKIKAMPPKLLTDDAKHCVIRPLAYCDEDSIARFARAMQYPIIPCTLCGSQPNMQRQAIKAMLAQWEKEFPGRTQSIFNATKDVRPSQLGDLNLFDFKGLDQRDDHTASPAFSLAHTDGAAAETEAPDTDLTTAQPHLAEALRASMPKNLFEDL